jgi:hypothetical protein
MSRRQPEPQFPVKLTQAQRKVLSDIAPDLARRLKRDDRGQRAISFTLAELRTVKETARSALRQANPGRGLIPLRCVFQACGQALDEQLGTAALPEESMREWFLAELRAVANQYQWQYVAPDRQTQVEQIAYRLWQEEGCPPGRQQEHWWQAQKKFHADKPIRGAILNNPKEGQGSQLLGPWQAVVHAKTGVVYPESSVAKLVEAGFPMTPAEARAIDAAADASSEGYNAAFRSGIAQAVGLER